MYVKYYYQFKENFDFLIINNNFALEIETTMKDKSKSKYFYTVVLV